jgi:hypothetical protein
MESDLGAPWMEIAEKRSRCACELGHTEGNRGVRMARAVVVTSRSRHSAASEQRWPRRRRHLRRCHQRQILSGFGSDPDQGPAPARRFAQPSAARAASARRWRQRRRAASAQDHALLDRVAEARGHGGEAQGRCVSVAVRGRSLRAVHPELRAPVQGASQGAPKGLRALGLS